MSSATGSQQARPAAVEDTTPWVVRMRGVGKAFPGVQALVDARLELRAGEVHVLLGENGAGKSTLMKVLCGQHGADTGSVEVAGRPVAFRGPGAAEEAGVVMIHQELNLVPTLSVAENIFLGQESSSRGLLRSRTMRAEAHKLLDRLGSDIDPSARVAELSVAEQQLVEIARALRERQSGAPLRVLVMDEPTAALAEHEIVQLFSVMRELCRRGVALVYISHRMEEIFEIGDRVTIMRDGRHIDTRSLRDTTPEALIEAMVGRAIGDQFPKREVKIGAKVLCLDNLRGPGVSTPVSLQIHAGEIFGLAGLMGAGRTELARLIFGATRSTSGQVQVSGARLRPGSPADAIRAGIGFVTEDRKGQGLVLSRSVGENINLAVSEQQGRAGVLELGRERARAADYLKKLRIRASGLAQAVVTLSGGNQQKVVLAKWLATHCRLLILDEPTRGIDVGAKAEIYELLGELVAEGMAILLISSEMPELLGLADRIGVMHEGRLQGVVEADKADQETLLSLALGRSVPAEPLSA